MNFTSEVAMAETTVTINGPNVILREKMKNNERKLNEKHHVLIFLSLLDDNDPDSINEYHTKN